MAPESKPRVLVLIVADDAEATILSVLNGIPALPGFEVEVLVIDDCSGDATYGRSERLRLGNAYAHPLTILSNPVNQGYGGNQKLGYNYAIEHHFDFVVLLQGDGQHTPEVLPRLLEPLARGEADVVLGSRLLTPGDARRGGMPLYKIAGAKILGALQNRLLRCQLTEFNTGCKACAVKPLRRIPFDLNSNAFHFDTELIIQFLRARARIVEIPIPTRSGGRNRRAHGLRYMMDALNAATVARLQDYGLVYRRNFDVAANENLHYVAKLHFLSTHSVAIAEVPPGATVLDVGCGPGHLCAPLRAKGCRLIGVDQFRPPTAAENFDEFHVSDLNTHPFPHPLDDVQVMLVLDIIEHLISPEKFCDELRQHAQANLGLKIVISTGNIGFAVTRLMLLLGQFNYNKRGILDLTHTRLFTFSSLRRLLQEAGFVVEKEIGIPAPAPLVVKNAFAQKFLMGLQALLIKISRGLFAYQMLMVVKPLPTLHTLMQTARDHTAQRSATVRIEVGSG